MLNDPQQSAQPTVVLVVLLVVVVVGMGHAVEVELQTSVSTSLSDRLSLDLTMSLTTVFPAFVPCFFVLTTAVNAPHAESVLAGLVSVPVTPFFTISFTFFRLLALQEPWALFTQAMSLKVQDWFGVVTPSWSQLGSQSLQVTVPPFSPPWGRLGRPSKLPRHSPSGVSFATTRPTNPARTTAKKTMKPMR